jgi:hypothetical protein
MGRAMDFVRQTQQLGALGPEEGHRVPAPPEDSTLDCYWQPIFRIPLLVPFFPSRRRLRLQ